MKRQIRLSLAADDRFKVLKMQKEYHVNVCILFGEPPHFVRPQACVRKMDASASFLYELLYFSHLLEVIIFHL